MRSKTPSKILIEKKKKKQKQMEEQTSVAVKL